MGNVLDNLSNGFEITVSSRAQKKYIHTEHTHNYHELHYLIKGTAEYFIDNDFFNLQSGDFIFIKKGLIHKTLCTPGSDRLVMCFTDEFISQQYGTILKDMVNQKRLLLSLSPRLEAEALLKKMENEYNAQQNLYLEMCKNLLQELTIHFYRHNHIKKQETLSENQKIIQNAAKYIAENYSRTLSLTDLADTFSMSPCHFSRTFKLHTSFGVNEYINIIRISNAEQLLATGKYTITEVANKCGYNNSNYFSLVFKKIKGLTPRKYLSLAKKQVVS